MMLDKCRQYHVSLNLKKCIFRVPYGILLGHIFFKQSLMVDLVKITIIVNLLVPNSIKKLCTTWGHTGYYMKFIKGYEKITAPMKIFMMKDVKYQ